MKLAIYTICILIPAVAMAQRPVARPPAGSAVIERALVMPIDEAQVPAQESGVLTKISVREGDQVQARAQLAQLDDELPRLQRESALSEFNAAQEKSKNDIEIRHADAAAMVAKFDYEKSKQASDRVSGTVSDVELKQKWFTWERTKLQKEQAEKQMKLDGYTATGKQAEVQAAEEGMRRRQIIAPIDGVVQKLYPHLGEWLKPGDPVFRLVRMDRLRVEGYLNKSEYNPSDVLEAPVSLEVELARGRKLQFPGKIVFVDPEVGTGGEYLVRAEVDNRNENGQWILRPGVQGTMAIQLR